MSTSCSFDPFDWPNFLFKDVGRDEATELLSGDDVQLGTFILRNSSRKGAYSVSVREDDGPGVRHYLLDSVERDDGKIRYTLGNDSKKDMSPTADVITFVDIPSLLNYYKVHLLDKVSLVRSAPLPVIGVQKFKGELSSDLNFERNEILDIIRKPEEGWWQARNSMGTIGMIPVNYVQTYNGEAIRLSDGSPSTSSLSSDQRFSGLSTGSDRELSNSNNDHNAIFHLSATEPVSIPQQPKVPSWVRVIHDRQPNAYDSTAFLLKKGQLIWLTSCLPSGMCEGEMDGKKGVFPFTYVEWVTETNGSLDHENRDSGNGED